MSPLTSRIAALAVLLAPAVALGADAAAEKAELKAAFAKLQGKVDEAKKNSPNGVLEPKKCLDYADDFAAMGQKQKLAEAFFNAGNLYNCGNNPQKAEAAWRDALQVNPNFAPAHVNLGEAAYQAGNQVLATSEFDAALKADPKNVQAYNGAALMLIEKARASGNDKAVYAEAIGKLRRALAVDGDSMPAYGMLALIYFTVAESDRSKLDLAELVCTQAKAVNANYAPIYNTLGLIKLRKKNVTGALQEFRKAADLEPGYVEAQLNIGAITLSARDYATAEKAFKAVLDAGPTDKQQLFDATMGMGVSARGQKRFDEAQQWYDKAKALDPKNCSVIYNVGVLVQDYLPSEAPPPQLPPNLVKARAILNDFIACGNAPKEKLDDAKARIKVIKETEEALIEAKKIEEEAKKAIEEAQRLEKQAHDQACDMWKSAVIDSVKRKQPIPAPFVPDCPALPEGTVPAGTVIPPYVDPNAPPPAAPAPAEAPKGK